MKRAATVAVTLAVLATAAVAGAPSSCGAASTTSPRRRSTSSRCTRCSRSSAGSRCAVMPAEIVAPRLDDPAQVARGALCYRDKCQVCHGGPGVAQGDIGRGMQPLPGPLVDAGRRFSRGRALLGDEEGHQDERHAGLGIPPVGRRSLGHGRLPRAAAGIDTGRSSAPPRSARPASRRRRRPRPRPAADPARGRLALTSTPAMPATSSPA